MGGPAGPSIPVSSRRDRRERGMVTAEAATVLPVLMALTVSLVWVLSLALTEVRCLDAAREAARLVARGDIQQARAVARQAGPPGASVAISTSAGLVRVTVSAQARPDLPLLGHLPAVGLSASAVSAEEDAGAP